MERLNDGERHIRRKKEVAEMMKTAERKWYMSCNQRSSHKQPLWQLSNLL